MVAVGRYGYGRDGGALPQILVIDFGYGHVEFVAQAVLETLDYVALLFQ